MKALLLAGGLGTRLRPLTEHLPKPMAPVVNRPWLEHLILHLKSQGISEFVIAVKHNADVIRRYFEDGSKFGVRIEYSQEPELLGTAGAIKHAEQLLTDRFIVVNADIINHVELVPLLEFHQTNGALVTIGLTEVDDPSHYGVVLQTMSGRIVRFVEKPPRHAAPSNRINAGIYVMEKEALKWIPAGREVSIERETFPTLIRKGFPVYGWLVRGYWLDMGTLDRYLALHRDVLDGKCALQLSYPEQKEGIWTGADVDISDDVTLVPPVVIGNGVKIGHGCVVGPYAVLGDKVTVESGSACSHSVALPGARLESNRTIRNAIFGQDFFVEVQPPVYAVNKKVVQR
ncbi:NDP-sugar synthase [Polycladomyces sp. WAk]|uniref:NDP-sugar synthase n=1 Tax=Polycladomyces zharkentensis TaxID=2807616 RepID=A0ABS2WHE4_9BACL|nr:NDP-sugar synthase [Polycladomyces sp. WAk]MBN2908903.1 NDP-sugar synthase [Polycladomyces sp. WAk]